MPDSTDSIQQQLAALRQGFADQLPQRLATIDAAHAAWCEGAAVADLKEYHRLVHSLTGAGATFGFERISQLARQLEQYLKQLGDAGGEVIAEHFIDAALLLDAIRSELLKDEQEEPLTAAVAETWRVPVASRLIYLLVNSETSESNLDRQLDHFGYSVKSFASGAALQQAVAENPPAMILADIVLPEGENAGIEAVAAIQRQQATPLPVVFFSKEADFDTRLAAVRARSIAYLSHPLSIEKLVDIMDGLVEREVEEPLRVLVVDDQVDQAHHNALVLRQAGMVTEVMSDSMKVFDTLAEFSPELILMDMYMPKCSGVELAAVIRQQPDYVGVPIVFLSSESDRSLQLDALRNGGDDFLTKPIKASDLAQAVTIRAERYRTLRSLMSRDSLTGLLNHTHIMESLDHEVARIDRYGATLSFAMLDIDHFKKVNDKYGHAAGDSVIKSLSRLLQQRLRKTDLAGRYGGEEFAVVMPDTPLINAAKVMDDVRQLFAAIVHCAGDKTFTVTLSCGVAAVPPVVKIGELQESADQRLYLAKHGGRNRVVSSDT